MKYESLVNELIENTIIGQDSDSKHSSEETILVSKTAIKRAIDEALISIEDVLQQIPEDIKEVADKTKSLDKAIDCAASAIGAALLLFDKDIALVSCSRSIPITDPVWSDTFSRGYSSYELREIVKHLPYLEDVDLETEIIKPTDSYSTRERLIYHIVIDHQSIGYLFVNAEENVVFSQFQIMAFKKAGEAMTYAISRYGRHLFPTLRTNDKLLRTLLSCLLTSDVEDVLKKESVPDYKRMAVICLDSRDQKHHNDELNQQIINIFPESITAIHKDRVVGLISLKTEMTIEDSQHKALEKLLKKNRIRGGVSNPFSDLKYFLQFYRQADKALELGKEGVLNRYQDVFISDFFDLVEDKEILQSIVHPAILRLKQVDKERNTDFVKTLEVLIKNNRNIKKSAELLFIHRNTMLHRIEQIEELTDLDLKDDDTALYLQISFALLNQS